MVSFMQLPRSLLQYKITDEIKQEIKQMVQASFSRTYYFRRCKSIRWSIPETIPDELVFEILLRLPAQDIYFAARFVCPKWYNMVRTKKFIRAHLEHASYGLVYRDESADIVFVSAREHGGGIDTFKLHFNCDTTVWSSCNGLMLKFDGNACKLIYRVANVSTCQAFQLPPFPYNSINSCIGYDATSMVYKVVLPYRDLDLIKVGHCAILTVGVDKSWRTVRTDHLSKLGKETFALSFPVITEGFVHWKCSVGTNVVTLNLETEIIAETPPPIPGRSYRLDINTNCCCLSTGRYLSLFHKCGRFVWEVFVMKPETGEWRKLPNICLEGEEGRMGRLGFDIEHVDVEIVPCGWLKYPEVLALRVQRVFIVFYNLITCKIGTERLSLCPNFVRVTLHKNTLVLI